MPYTCEIVYWKENFFTRRKMEICTYKYLYKLLYLIK